MPNGKLIVLEGLDRSGKTTVIKKLEKDFPEAVFTREPGGSEFALAQRELLLSELGAGENALTQFLTFLAARSSHFHKLIGPALSEDKIIFSDRLDASTYAFQLYGKQNYDLDESFFLLRKMILGMHVPWYIYLDVSPETCFKRGKNIKESESTHFDRAHLEFHQRVKKGYEMFFPKVRPFVRIVNAEKNVDNVYADVLSAVKDILAQPAR